MPDASSLPTPQGTFRVSVGERTFELAFDAGRLTVDGDPVDYAFERIAEGYFALRIEGRSLPVTVEPLSDGRVRVTMQGRQTTVRVQDEKDLLLERFGLDDAAAGAERAIRAPMPGLVLRVAVEAGQSVQAGDGLLVLEAMKMENELRAPADGVVAALHVAEGDAVGKDDLLLEME